MKNPTTLVLALVLVLFAPSLASAKSIGASPSELRTVVYEGDVIRESITISKSDTEDELAFSVSQEGDRTVDLLGQSRLVIPAGENSASIDFDIGSAGLAVGEYDSKISFLMDTVTQPNGQSMIYGLNVKVHVSVQPRPDPSVTLDVSSYPLLGQEVSVGGVSATTRSVKNGRRVRVEWDLENSGRNPLSGVVSKVVVARNGEIVNPQFSTVSGTVSVNKPTVQAYEFDLMEPASSGKYDVTVISGGQEVGTAVWVVQPALRRILMALLGAALTAVGLAAYGRTGRRKCASA